MEKLHRDLKDYLEHETDAGFPMLRHPLLYAVPYFEDLNDKYNASYEAKRRKLEEAKEESDWGQVLLLYERPYRLLAFVEHYHMMSDEEFGELLGWVWMDAESPGFVNRDVWMRLFEMAAEKGGRQSLMDKHDWAQFKGFPDELTIYRGADKRETKRKLGISWSLQLNTAQWFANRFDKGGRVWVGRVDKGDVWAFFAGRSEAEIVVNPKKIKGVKLYLE